MASSPTKRLGYRPLIVPSPETPWSVDVVSAIPKDVMSVTGGSLAANNYVVGTCRASRWFCVATIDKAGRCNLHVWHVPPNTSLEDQKHKLPVSKIFHPKLQPEASETKTAQQQKQQQQPTLLLLAMEVSPQSADVVYLYAAQPVTGVVVLWKLSPKDLQKPLPPAAKCTLFLDLLTNDSSNSSNSNSETVTSLTVEWKSKHASPMIGLGTARGRVFYVVQTHVPIALHAQVADPSAQSSLLARLWKTVQYQETAAVVAILAARPEKEFYTVAASGCIGHWTVTPTQAHKAYFQATERANLLLQLRDYLQREVHSLEVQQAAMPAAADSMHVLVLTTHPQEESRLYWIRLVVAAADETSTMELESAVWLSRFGAPASVQVAGWLVADNGDGYGAFVQDASLPAIVMSLAASASTGRDHAAVVVEVDLPVEQVQSVFCNTLAKDVVTHGCSILTASGMGLRVRCISSPQRSSTSTLAAPDNASNPSAVATLTSHLRSTFWEDYQHADQNLRVPPSLAAASLPDLERAVVAVAILLKQKGDVSSMQNPTEWHMAFITLLQQKGFYRSLSATCKWTLLGIGQELAVFWWLGNSFSNKAGWMQEKMGDLAPHGLANWLEQIQESVLAQGGGEDRQEEWNQWLVMALDSAMRFREEHASFTYDVSADQPPLASNGQVVPVWTSCPTMQRILERQLLYWKSNAATAHVESVETVVTAALRSFGDSYATDPVAATHGPYKRVLQLAIPFLRIVKGKINDQLAFSLSKTHKYYWGLCQIALDHEKMTDQPDFALDPLFSQLDKNPDLDTGMLFAEFVLKWHTERELFGHVLNYGKNCPHVLNQFTQNEQTLRPFRWIQAIRQGDYNGATDSLMRNAEIGAPLLSEAKFDLSMARMANTVVERETRTRGDVVGLRRQRIEKKMELVNAQQDLFGDEASKYQLWEASSLIDYTLEQLKQAGNTSDKIQACFIGLAICSSFESDEASHEHAATVWWNALMADSALWGQWLRNETNLTDKELAEEVLQRTVFGGLFQQSEEVESWGEVLYGPKLESDIIEKMAQQDESAAAGMRRLLRSLTPGRW